MVLENFKELSGSEEVLRVAVHSQCSSYGKQAPCY